MYDYVDGKVDWMAFGLPVEGEDGPFLGDQLAPVVTCAVTQTVADARRELSGADDDAVVIVEADGLAVGEVDEEALAGQPDDTVLLEVLRPVPSTVRPSVTVASVAEGGGGGPLVTDSDGRLLGRATLEPAHDHEGDDHGGDDHGGDDHGADDHEGHDHGEPSVDLEGYEAELTAVLAAVEERFGEEEPSAEELRSFLRERLVAEGRSVEEADRFLEDQGVGEPE